MTNKPQLISKLRQFTENIRSLKRLTATGNITDRQQYNELVNSNARILQAIQAIFTQIYSNNQGDVSTDKLKKQFTSLLSNYQQQLKKQEREQEKQIKQLRKTYTNLRQSLIQKKQEEDSFSESERGVNFEMVEINQETLHYERMIEMKEKQIKTIKDRMVGALKVQEDLKNLVDQQGGRLDQAENHVNEAHKNTNEAQENLVEAREEHISSKKKQICIFIIVLAIMLIIIVPIIIKFA